MTARIPAHLKLALSVHEAAEMVSVSDSTIRRLIDDGHLAKVPFTDRVLIARAELERWVQSGRAA